MDTRYFWSEIFTTAWRIDPFGSTDTSSKLYHDCGFTNSVVMRIPYRVANKFKEENMKDMKWKLSDGSELLTHVMVDYCVPMFHE